MDADDCGESGSKIKIRSLNSLVGDASTSMTEFTIGDIVEHGDFVGSDESGVMHLKITNVMSVDESITGCIGSEEDKEEFSNIQIASVSTLMEEDPAVQALGQDQATTSSSDTLPSASASVLPTSNKTVAVLAPITPLVSTTVSGAGNATLQIVNLQALSPVATVSSAPASTALCVVPSADVAPAVPTEPAPSAAPNRIMYCVIRSSVSVPRICGNCRKSTTCTYRVHQVDAGGKILADFDSVYLCSDSCREMWKKKLPANTSIEKPRRYFERVCGNCGNEINDSNNKAAFSWETREFCSKACLADFIGYVGQFCRQCLNTVRLLYMGKYCVRFGSDIYQFCSNTCLESYKINIQVCCYCQKNLANVDPKERKEVSSGSTTKKYCGNKCYRRALRMDVNQQYYNEKKICTVCTTLTVPRFEFMKDDETNYLCNQSCLNVFKFANSYKAVNCCLCLRLLCVEGVIHFLYHNNGQLRVFCSVSCTNVFILSTRRIVTCSYCKVKKYNFDMIHLHDETAAAYYCSVCCLNLHKSKEDVSEEIPNSTQADTPTSLPPDAVSSTGALPLSSLDALSPHPTLAPRTLLPVPAPALPPSAPPATAPASPALSNTGVSASAQVPAPVPQLTQCNMCSKLSPAQFHMVMSDNTLRNFCSYSCASRYKATFGFLVSTKPTLSLQAQIPSMVNRLPLPQLAAPRPQYRAPIQPNPLPPTPTCNSPPILSTTSKTPATKEVVVSEPAKAALEESSSPGSKRPTSISQLPSREELERLLELIKKNFTPKPMANKATMCKPVKSAMEIAQEIVQATKLNYTDDMLGMANKAQTCLKCQEKDNKEKNGEKKERIYIPVPIPVFVPTPMAMYSVPVPEPFFIPVPIPIPQIIPVSAANTDALLMFLKELREKYPSKKSEQEIRLGKISEEISNTTLGYKANNSVDVTDSDTDNIDPETKKIDYNVNNVDSAANITDNKRITELDTKLDDLEYKGETSVATRDNVESLLNSCSDASEELYLNFDDAIEALETSNIDFEANDMSSVSWEGNVTEDSKDDDTTCLNSCSEQEKSINEHKNTEKICTETSDHQNDCEKGRTKRARDDTEVADTEDEFMAYKRRRVSAATGGGETCEIWTRLGIEAWTLFVTEQNSREERDGPQLPLEVNLLRSSELNKALTQFVELARMPGDKAYRPDTLFFLLLCLQRYLFEKGKKYCIFLDSSFFKFNQALNQLIEPLAIKLSTQVSPRSPDLSTAIVEEDFWQCNMLGAHTPNVLLNTVFYFLTKYFRRLTICQHDEFEFSNVVKDYRQVDGQEFAVLILKDEADGKTYEIVENKEDRFRCPVKLYEFYLSKCNTVENCAFYVYPLSTCSPDSDIWYTQQKLESEHLSLMLYRSLLVKEVLERSNDFDITLEDSSQ